MNTDSSDEMSRNSNCVKAWLANFERSLLASDGENLRTLFSENSHWKDLLAFTWSITPHDSQSAIIDNLIALQPEVQASNFCLDEDRTPPRRVKRLGIDSIEAIFSFQTRAGRGHGLLRLLAENPEQAWVFTTSLEEIKGHEEPIGARRPDGSSYSRMFGGSNWSDNRKQEITFERREPEVLIIGGGQAGLSVAARLRLLGVSALVVDRNPRVGDVWRNRYRSLALHNKIGLNHMAYLPFPPNWPEFLPKDMIANWLETYSWAMECNVWTGTTFLGAEYNEKSSEWSARVRTEDGKERLLRPQHIVFANGIAGRPIIPEFKGLQDFSGTLMHTHEFDDGSAWAGKKAVVIGTGTSGHDVAQDLQSHGAEVKLVQRGSTTVASIKAAGLVHSVYYNENLPLEDADLVGTSSTYPLLIRGHQLSAEKMKEIDADMIAGLKARGFRIDYGEDETGHQMKFRRRHGGYYLDCGCSNLIIEEKIGLLQFEDVDCFVPQGIRMKDGSLIEADLIVSATGYQNQQEVVRELLGDGVADKIGRIWGIADDGELANMYRATAQQGLWFIGGGFSHARIYSHYIALRIKADQLGLVNDRNEKSSRSQSTRHQSTTGAA